MLVSFPWWVAAALAVIAFVVLHSVVPVPNGEVTNPIMKGLVAGSANLAPLASTFFGIAALLSAFGAWRRRRLLDDQAGIEDIRKLDWQDFERLVGEAYRRQGYTVLERGLGGSDGGVDLELYKGDEHILVQCKHWQSWKVGVKPLRELYGVVAAEKATGGIFVASGEYSREALAFARENNLRLVNGGDLVHQIKGVQQPLGASRPARQHNALISFLVPVAVIMGSLAYLFSGTQLANIGSRPIAAPVAEASVQSADRHQLIREARARFEAEYEAPAGCDKWTSDREMVGCTNHLMRARREFIQRHPEYVAVKDWEL